ncbi:ferric reductase-like transmembrane domain-containing protein [Anaerosolibacter sp.]|uniref:ferric reductase-like transmembrane domain-containing protein n=2 Tax=Bacillota TaxID=1239 RepID=UPI0039F13917
MNLFMRHLVVGLTSSILVYLFLSSRSEWSSMHAWNRAYADVSLLLLFITIMIGPLSRLNNLFIRFLSWRRELGIWCFIMALLHVYVLFQGWFYWEPIRLIIGVNQETGQLSFDPGFTLANLVGGVGLAYLFLLALISNNYSIKVLGRRSWDYLQKKSGTLYILGVLHTAYFLFFFRLGNYNWVQKPFLVTVTVIFVLQWAVFIRSVYQSKNRRKIE